MFWFLEISILSSVLLYRCPALIKKCKNLCTNDRLSKLKVIWPHKPCCNFQFQEFVSNRVVQYGLSRCQNEIIFYTKDSLSGATNLPGQEIDQMQVNLYYK
jgi:hypothetical protein